MSKPYQIRKMYRVEYAHQLSNSFTKGCSETIHGHSGKIELFFSSFDLDENNVVIDFGEISALVKKYIMDTYDHSLFISNDMDDEYISILKKYNKKLHVLDENTTAEYFAAKIFDDVCSIFQSKSIIVKLCAVRFHETETGYAEFKKIN